MLRTSRAVYTSHANSDSNLDQDTPVFDSTLPCMKNSWPLSPHVPIHPFPTVSPTPGAAPSQQSTWPSTSTVPLWQRNVPLRLPALLATPEWSTDDCYGDGGDGMGGGDGGGDGGCGSISEFRRQRRLERDKMYRDAIGSTLSMFSQATSSHTQLTQLTVCTESNDRSNDRPYRARALAWRANYTRSQPH